MKKKVSKYALLLVVTFAISILIYNYVESFKPIKTEGDILITQKELENNYFSNTDYTIDNPNVILNPYGNSPLSAIVVFQTNDLTTATVTIKGKDGASDLVHTFTPAKVHILPIYGLYAGYENKVIIDVSGQTKELTIKTDDLPSDFSKVTSFDSSLNDSEFYFTTPEDKGYTAAYDSNAEVRWYMVGDYKWDIQRLNNGHILMSSDKTISGNYSAGLVEMDLLGKVYFEYAIPGGYHHSAFELNNGNLLLLSNNLDGDTKEDYIVTVDRNSGKIVKEIDLNKILQNNKKGNYFKATSVVYDINTNSITVSGYNSNMLVNIDYSSLNINWIIGENVPSNLKDLSLSKDGDGAYPTKPLSINLNDGKISFINEVDGNRYLTTYKIDYSNRSFMEDDSIKLESAEDGSLEIIDDSHFIVTLGNMIQEFEDDDVVYNLSLNSSLYNTKKMTLYANDIYTGVQGVRLGSLGVSKTSMDFPIFNARKDNSIMDKYDIKLYKDVFGLKVSGSFDKDDKVQIILDNVLDKKTYDLDVTNGASRYINEEGINGKYYIYLKINGKIYKLYKYVNFY